MVYVLWRFLWCNCVLFPQCPADRPVCPSSTYPSSSCCILVNFPPFFLRVVSPTLLVLPDGLLLSFHLFHALSFPLVSTYSVPPSANINLAIVAFHALVFLYAMNSSKTAGAFSWYGKDPGYSFRGGSLCVLRACCHIFIGRFASWVWFSSPQFTPFIARVLEAIVRSRATQLTL